MKTAERKAVPPKDVFFNVRVDAETHRRLAELAARNYRTVAAEIRLAVRERLERES